MTGRRRSGFILADVLAGLGVLAAGLAAFLGCMSQSHRLVRSAEQLREWRGQAVMQLGAPSRAAATAVLARAPGRDYPGPARLRDAGTGLCEFEVRPAKATARTARPVRTVRFCTLDMERAP